MKVIFYFSVLYILTIGSIWSFYIDILSRYNINLASTTNKINGVDYLKLLHTLSTDVTIYQGYIAVNDNPKDKSQRKQSIVENIQKIYTLQKQYPILYNKDLAIYLEQLEDSKMSYYDYYDFLDYINHENYIVGNKSEILFSQDKERYFLGTLITHYLPEFFISIGIVHNLLEELTLYKNIDKAKKNIFIEHHKLVYLSCNELENIINLLSEYDNTKEFLILIENIKSRLKQLKDISGISIISNYSQNNMEIYLKKIHEIAKTAEQLNDKNTILLEALLKNDKQYITNKIRFYQLLLIFLILLVTIIIFHFFRIFTSNIKKDKELKTLNSSLQERVLVEVNKNRQKDQQLLQQSRFAQMGEMISMISHQWRQPLSAISATSASIELKARLNKLDNDTAQLQAHNISNFAQHLSRTIDDFRNFFKPNKKKRKTTYDEVIKSVLGIVETSLTNKNIRLTKELDCHNIFMSYPNELQQVILNLIKNAEDVLLEKEIKNAYIKIKTYQQKDKYILEVSDNGGGIPEGMIEKIFDPYFSTKTKKEGTGLGLYMSKMIIEEHCDGKINVLNTNEGALLKIEIKSYEDF